MTAHTPHPPHVTDELLHGYADGSLPAEARTAVEQHLAGCAACRADVAALRELVAAARGLPHSIEPERDLWPGIEPRLAPPGVNWRRWGLPLAATVILALGVTLVVNRRDPQAWRVASVDGAPRVGATAARAARVVRPGDRLETGAGGRLALRVGEIGTVELGAGTSARLISATADAQRLALEYGTLEAVILAPPRLFVVETPSAVATDLGCAYTLAVDSAGQGILHVTEGWVELSRPKGRGGGRVVVVPRDAYAELRPGAGPGTPFVADAPAELRQSLLEFDRTSHAGAARAALAAARPADAVSVMNLLALTEGELRGAAYDRLALLVPPPSGVTRDGVLALDAAMLSRWWDRIAPPVLTPESPTPKKKLRFVLD